MANFKEKIGIYGGSFNPIHYGHLKIAQLAIKTLLLDKLILVPSYQNTLKKVKPWHQISHDHRLAMLRLVLKPKMIISDYEIVHQINESYLTIDHFQKQYHDAEIFMIIGSDLLDGLTKWEKTTEMSQKCQLVCFQRNKFIKTHPNISKYNIDLYHNKLFHISSTNYHKLLQLDFVPTIIQKYIGTNLLYFENYYQYLNAQEWQQVIKNLKFVNLNYDYLQTYTIMIRLILSYANQQQVKPQKEEEFYQLVNNLKQHLFTNYQLNPQLKWTKYLLNTFNQLIEKQIDDYNLTIIMNQLMRVWTKQC